MVTDFYFIFSTHSVPCGRTYELVCKTFLTLTPILYEEVGTTISNNVSDISTKDLLASEQF
jgi:hypothetical protein